MGEKGKGEGGDERTAADGRGWSRREREGRMFLQGYCLLVCYVVYGDMGEGCGGGGGGQKTYQGSREEMNPL